MIDLDAADLIDSLSTGTYTVTRRAAPTYAAGVAAPGSTTTLEIVAAVVPTAGRDLLRLPEGQRSTESRTVFTATQLLVAAQASVYASDLVAIDGDSWEVQLVERWYAATGYWRAVVQRAGTVQP